MHKTVKQNSSFQFDHSDMDVTLKKRSLLPNLEWTGYKLTMPARLTLTLHRSLHGLRWLLMRVQNNQACSAVYQLLFALNSSDLKGKCRMAFISYSPQAPGLCLSKLDQETCRIPLPSAASWLLLEDVGFVHCNWQPKQWREGRVTKSDNQTKKRPFFLHHPFLHH